MIKSEQYNRLSLLFFGIVVGALIGGTVQKYMGGLWVGLLMATLLIIWAYWTIKEIDAKFQEDNSHLEKKGVYESSNSRH